MKLNTFILSAFILFHISAYAQLNRKLMQLETQNRGSTNALFSTHLAGQIFEIRDGVLWAAGTNSNGQLGDSTKKTPKKFIQINAGNNWVSVAPGILFTIGIKSDGTLWGWGANDSSQLGIMPLTDHVVPTRIGTDSDWVSVAAGMRHCLGLKNDGSLWAWGGNAYGKLGNGTTTKASVPIRIGTDNNWIAIVAGADHSMGLKSDGTLWTWGDNRSKQLGRDATVSYLVPGKVGTDHNWAKIACGFRQSFGIKADGSLWCWGQNTYGVLGLDSAISQAVTPVRVGNSNKWVHIASGNFTTMGIQADGSLWTWGNNLNGEMGNDNQLQPQYTPKRFGLDNDWCYVTGSSICMARKANGSLWHWGANFSGYLGDSYYSSVPVEIGKTNCWANLTSGSSHALGLRTNGTLWSWGDNLFAQLGIGNNTMQTGPVNIGGNTWSYAAAGFNFSAGIKANGTIWCWGDNSNGQLGDATLVSQKTPVQTGHDSDWVKMAVGAVHTLAIKSDGTLWAWGGNANGQLGDGSTVNKNIPVRIGTDSNWVFVKAGFVQSFAIKSNGTLWTWGDNAYGQLGIGNNNQQNTPVQIGTDNKWISIAAGDYHTLGLKANGTLWAWGRNTYSQLGNGNQTSSNIPQQVGTSTDWMLVAAGQYHSIAVKADGSFWGWGNNGFGELGNGFNNSLTTPTKTSTDNKWISITAGGNFSYRLGDERKWYCATGANGSGQLGDGSTVNKNSFVCNNACLVPPNPVTKDSSICAGTRVTLRAMGEGYISWYSDSVGGTFLGTDTVFTTPILTTNKTFYVQDSICGVSEKRTPLRVTVLPVPVVTANVTDTVVCFGEKTILSGSGIGSVAYTWSGGAANGIPYAPANTGFHVVTGTGSNGCKTKDSVFVRVKPTPNLFITKSGANLKVAQANASYQWLTCPNGYVPIAGATAQSYLPASNGNYAVRVLFDGCADTSSCIVVTNVGINENAFTSPGLFIYPNPSGGEITVSSMHKGTFVLLNQIGQVLQTFTLLGGQEHTWQLSGLSAGVYYIAETGPSATVMAKKIVVLQGK